MTKEEEIMQGVCDKLRNMHKVLTIDRTLHCYITIIYIMVLQNILK